MSASLRILYHHRTQGRGAEGNHIVSIVTALRELGHVVDVISPPGVDPFSAASTIPVDKAKTKTRGWASAWKYVSLYMPNWLFELAEILYNMPAYFNLRRVLSEKRYDLVFERYAFFMVAGAMAARAANCKFLLEANEACGIQHRARKQSFPRLCRAFERFLLKRCTAVHAVSSHLGTLLVETGLDPQRLVVVPNGFEVARLQLTRGRDTVREQLGLGEACVIGFAGWFDVWDRLDFMLEVFERLRKQRDNLKLCLVGAGPAMESFNARLVDSPYRQDVVLTGAVARNEVYNYIQTFDIGVLPHSNNFGSPIVMFEMMGLRVPMALPRLPPIEDVHLAGKTAEIFNPLDAEDCSGALDRLLESKEYRAGLSENSYTKLVNQHTWRDTATRILAKTKDVCPSWLCD